ncbi:MAG: TolB family protein, partial [Thermoanaerobaculia bacterium]
GSGSLRSLRAVTLSGEERLLSNVPGGLTLRDISKSGHVLLTHDNVRKGIMGMGPGQAKERELSWLEWSIPVDLSDDGSTLLFDEQGQAIGDRYAICLRKMDGSPVIRLGDGFPGALSPDGKWVIALLLGEQGTPVKLLPTGTGQPRTVISGDFAQYGPFQWLSDSRRFVFDAMDAGKERRLYLQDSEGGPPRALTPPGHPIKKFLLSGDRKTAFVQESDGGVVEIPVDGGTPRPYHPNMNLGGFEPIRFSGDDRSLFARDLDKIPVGIYRFDVATGRKELMKQVSPGDPAGLQGIRTILLSADGRFYAYAYTRSLSDLYTADGFR